jgi:hypothetical protein
MINNDKYNQLYHQSTTAAVGISPPAVLPHSMHGRQRSSTDRNYTINLRGGSRGYYTHHDTTTMTNQNIFLNFTCESARRGAMTGQNNL